ncbi:hypothetical protein [Paenibacillus paeoniae]|nr:hypothetical protein [Paenibacillus paeoniae]
MNKVIHEGKMKVNRGTLWFVGLLMMGLVLLLASCSGPLEAVNETDNKSPVQESDFIHRLYLEKKDYREGDQVTFISELEYVGDRESVTINHGMTPFSYAIRESSGKYLYMYIMDQPLIYTTLYPGQPYVEKYSSGWAYTEEGEGEELKYTPVDVPFPAGDYTVVGSAKFNIGEFGEDNENEGPIEILGKELLFSVAP